MKKLEFARIAFSNELKHTGVAPKFDGELLKRLCSNGDTIELRTNHKDEIQIRLQTTFVMAFMGRLFPAKIDEYVLKLYGLKPNKPSKLVDGKMVQDRGFCGLDLRSVGFDESAARITRNESLRQSVRHTTHDNFTPDTRVGGL